MTELIETPPQAAAPEITPEQQAFRLTYAFHEMAKNNLKQSLITLMAATAGILGAAALLPSFSTLAGIAYAGYIAWDIHNGRKQNLILRDVFNNATKDYGEKLQSDLRPLEEALSRIEPFGKKDLDTIKNQVVGSPGSVAISFGMALFVPIALPFYAVAAVSVEEKQTMIKIQKAAMEAGGNLKNRHPDLNM